MASTVETITASGTWYCPPDVTSIRVEIRAPGGGSGGLTTDTFAIGGAAGGQYVKKNSFTVTPGTGYTVTIGAVGAAGANTPTDGTAGGDTWFSSNDANGVVAKGGAPSLANSRTGGLGSTAGGIGDTVNAGGNGADSVLTAGGGGGEGGGSAGTGGSAVGTTGGSGTDGGNGGAGATNGVGGAATAYGGGGGGSASTSTNNRAGRAGAAGSIVLTYTTPLASVLTDNFDDNSIDVAKWNTATEVSGTVSESSQTIILTPAASSTNSYAALVSDHVYDLTASSVYVKATQVASGADVYTELALSYEAIAGYANALVLYALNSFLLFDYAISGVYTTVASIAYNASTMLWWRLRESGGNVYADYSSNGTSWTNLGSVAIPITITSLYSRMDVFESISRASPGVAIFDNFNTTGASAVTVKTLAALGVG